MDDVKVKQLCDVIRQTGFEVHKYFRHGHLEKVYENALAHRLRKSGLKVDQQYSINVYDEDGTSVGEFKADLFVEDFLVVELKARKEINNDHIAQILGYLRASRKEHGLLINFGAPKYWIKKYIMNDHASN